MDKRQKDIQLIQDAIDVINELETSEPISGAPGSVFSHSYDRHQKYTELGLNPNMLPGLVKAKSILKNNE